MNLFVERIRIIHDQGSTMQNTLDSLESKVNDYLEELDQRKDYDSHLIEWIMRPPVCAAIITVTLRKEEHERKTN